MKIHIKIIITIYILTLPNISFALSPCSKIPDSKIIKQMKAKKTAVENKPFNANIFIASLKENIDQILKTIFTQNSFTLFQNMFKNIEKKHYTPDFTWKKEWKKATDILKDIDSINKKTFLANRTGIYKKKDKEENILQKKWENCGQVLFCKDKKKVFSVGDIHGDDISLWAIIYDFLESIEKGEDPLIIFTGDLIDRGPRSLNCLITVLMLQFTLKNLFPNKDYVFIARGNHEDLPTALKYGFALELYLTATVLNSNNNNTFINNWYKTFLCFDKFFKKLPTFILTFTNGSVKQFSHTPICRNYKLGLYGGLHQDNVSDFLWARPNLMNPKETKWTNTPGEGSYTKHHLIDAGKYTGVKGYIGGHNHFDLTEAKMYKLLNNNYLLFNAHSTGEKKHIFDDKRSLPSNSAFPDNTPFYGIIDISNKEDGVKVKLKKVNYERQWIKDNFKQINVSGFFHFVQIIISSYNNNFEKTDNQKKIKNIPKTINQINKIILPFLANTYQSIENLKIKIKSIKDKAQQQSKNLDFSISTIDIDDLISKKSSDDFYKYYFLDNYDQIFRSMKDPKILKYELNNILIALDNLTPQSIYILETATKILEYKNLLNNELNDTMLKELDKKIEKIETHIFKKSNIKNQTNNINNGREKESNYYMQISDRNNKIQIYLSNKNKIYNTINDFDNFDNSINKFECKKYTVYELTNFWTKKWNSIKKLKTNFSKQESSELNEIIKHFKNFYNKINQETDKNEKLTSMMEKLNCFILKLKIINKQSSQKSKFQKQTSIKTSS